MLKFLHAANNDDNNKAVAIAWIFSENSQAKNESLYPCPVHTNFNT